MPRKPGVKSDIKDAGLAPAGELRIEWASREMPVLKLIGSRFTKEKPLKDLVVGGCLHVTTETANLALALQAGGASVFLCASNPLSTQDDVAAALVVNHGIPVFAIKGEDEASYYRHINAVLEAGPVITVDDGADLTVTLHKSYPRLLKSVVGGMEETTTGVIRLKSMAAEKELKYPIIAVNEAQTKHFFDNRYGTGQSTIDGITRATNVLWAGKNVVVCGYGWCGRGIALRAKGLGSQVIVTEVDPIRALEAAMDGYRVMPMIEAARIGDIFVTVTGGISAIDSAHLKVMKDGALLANSGHFNVEINIKALEKMSAGRRKVRTFVEEFALKDGRRLHLLGEGRLINLAAAEGHPASVMDMSFANQALCAEHMANLKKKLKVDVYTVPTEIDCEVGRLKLQSLGINIDCMTDEQKRYASSWQWGT